MCVLSEHVQEPYVAWKGRDALQRTKNHGKHSMPRGHADAEWGREEHGRGQLQEDAQQAKIKREPTSEDFQIFSWRKRTPAGQSLVFSLKPMTAEKKAQGLIGDEYEKARICLQGQNHEGFQVQNSTTNADAHLLRPVLSSTS